MAKSERSRAKAKAWKAFSYFIRIRDADPFLSSDEPVGRCITCGAIIPVKGNDAGHYVPGRSDAVLFEEHNCHLQCVGCNRFRQGMFIEYELALRLKYGDEEVERLKALKFAVKKYSIPELNDLAKRYKEKAKEIYEANFDSRSKK